MVLPDFLSSGPALAAREAQLAYIWTAMKSLSRPGLVPWCVPFPAESRLQKQPCGGLFCMRWPTSFQETPSVSGWLRVELNCYSESYAHQ